MTIRVGSAPDSWGVWFASDPRRPPWQRVLDEVAEAGYEGTELGPFGYLPTDLAASRGEMDAQGAIDFIAFGDVLREIEYDGWVTGAAGRTPPGLGLDASKGQHYQRGNKLSEGDVRPDPALDGMGRGFHS